MTPGDTVEWIAADVGGVSPIKAGERHRVLDICGDFAAIELSTYRGHTTIGYAPMDCLQVVSSADGHPRKESGV